MERVSIRLAAAAAASAASAFALAVWNASGFLIDDTGFRSTSGASDTFRFAHPLAGKLERRDKYESEITCRLMAPNPKSVWIGSWAPGFEFYLPYGLELGLNSLVGPNLTVRDASYGPGTPTPASQWILLTFSDMQPAVLFAFLGAPSQMIVEGSSGNWKLRTTGRYRGRVRVCLPFGLKPLSGNNVGTLGNLAKVVSDQGAFWAGPRPRLVASESVVAEDSATLRYRFDRPGALIPPVAILAKAGGNALKTATPVFDPDRYTETGPVAFSTVPRIELTFPLRRIPAARAVALDSMAPDGAASAAESLASAALRSLLSGTQPPRPDPAHEVDSRASEPLDVSAAKVLQTVAQSRAYGPFDSVATVHSLLRAWDPVSWCLKDDNPVVSSRATAFAALSAALETEGSSDLYGALLNAGLDARRGLAKFSSNRGLPEPGLVVHEPFRAVLRSLYSDVPKSLEESVFCQALLSPLRLMSDQAMTAASVPLGLEVKWSHRNKDRSVLVFGVSCPYTVFKGANIESLEAKESFGVLTVRYVPQSEGPCSVILKPPKWGPAMPSLSGLALIPAAQ